ncbi:MAG: hypothetical protein FJ267_19825, partial [Planctomycetes bacterium]|nr:hypothetical protein [Planctomycetota bacterium]
AQMLERLFPQSNVAAAPTSNTGLFGSLQSGLSTVGRGVMSATGLNQTLGGAANLRIVTDVRSNALFVTGPAELIREVEGMLEYLDASEFPESLRDRVPRSIPVEHADIEEVYEIIESVFKDAMTPQGGNANEQNQQRFNPLAMLMGGGGGAGSNRKQPTVELTIGIDRRTSHLIVSCSETLFRQIESQVQLIDERAHDARQTVRIHRLETADPGLVSETLTSLIPKVRVSTSRSGSRKKPGENPDPSNPQANQQNQPPEATRDTELLRRTMQQRFQQRRGGDSGFQGGNPFEGGFPGGNQGGGGGGNRGRRGGGRGGQGND